MAQLPPFSFPLLQEDEDDENQIREGVNGSHPFAQSNADQNSKPRISLQTSTTPTGLPSSRPLQTQILVDMSPPSSPTFISHSKSSSASSIANSLSSLRRGDSSSSLVSFRRRAASTADDFGVSSQNEEDRPGSKELKVFSHWMSDYEIRDQDRKKPLGSGLWSDVYLAAPCLPKEAETAMSVPASMSALTPPITPVTRRSSSGARSGIPELPRAYAIKHPASKAAKAVLRTEASILSYLSRFPESRKYMVQFFGLDTRNEALVLRAMDMTLESFVQKELDVLGEPERTQKLKNVFSPLAMGLAEGLEWLGERGVVHADIKPGNILVDTSSSNISAVYSDFSSSLLLTAGPSPSPSAPLGGGTWDFLDPLLLSTSLPASPSSRSDLWSLAITLLFVVTGASPFDAAGNNIFRRREMVKQGTPLSYVGYGDFSVRNMARLRGLECDIEAWFGLVLRKDPMKRLDVRAWRGSLEALCSSR